MVPKRVHRRWFVGYFAVALVLAALDPAASGGTLHVLVAADVQDRQIGLYAQSNAIQMLILLSATVRQGDYSIDFYPDPNDPPSLELTEAKLLAMIKNLDCARDDAILFYYSGRGEFRPENQFVLLTRNGAESIRRSKIVQAIKDKKVGLTVVLTDAAYAVKPQPPQPPAAGAPIVPETLPLFKKLFFRTKGVVDVNACAKGQIAVTCPDPHDGSVFSLALRHVLEQEQQSDKSWKEILAEVQQEMADQFKKLYPDGVPNGPAVQRTQTIDRIELRTVVDGQPTPNGPAESVPPANPASGDGPASRVRSRQLGLTVVAAQGRIKIDNVEPNQPATRCVDAQGRRWFLQPGDVISQINGGDVGTLQEFSAAVRKSPYTMELTVIGATDQEPHRFRTNVNPRFGVSPGENGGRGVRAVSVVPGSAATQCSDRRGHQWRLDVGDVITEINGQAINSIDQFRAAIAGSAQKMTLVVLGSDGQTRELVARLGD